MSMDPITTENKYSVHMHCEHKVFVRDLLLHNPYQPYRCSKCGRAVKPNLLHQIVGYLWAFSVALVFFMHVMNFVREKNMSNGAVFLTYLFTGIVYYLSFLPIDRLGKWEDRLDRL